MIKSLKINAIDLIGLTPMECGAEIRKRIEKAGAPEHCEFHTFSVEDEDSVGVEWREDDKGA
jgi:hypothetical protein